jgi:hypothetical protein
MPRPDFLFLCTTTHLIAIAFVVETRSLSHICTSVPTLCASQKMNMEGRDTRGVGVRFNTMGQTAFHTRKPTW